MKRNGSEKDRLEARRKTESERDYRQIDML